MGEKLRVAGRTGKKQVQTGWAVLVQAARAKQLCGCVRRTPAKRVVDRIIELANMWDGVVPGERCAREVDKMLRRLPKSVLDSAGKWP